MESPKLALILFCLLCISSLSSQHEQLSRKNGIVRHKKKVTPLKKPLRNSQHHHQQQHERPARRSNFPPRDTTSPDQDFVATSEHPTVSWKPITYAVYSHSPVDTSKPTESTVPIAERTDRPQPRQEDQVTDQNQEYTLYQYYIPFEQLITHHSKPIIEHPADPPKEPLTLDKLNKAAVEPVTVFKKENEGESSSSSHSENDNEFTGRYEYEYFVQDDHWGTNFGHKEYRDEKYTKGDYEVVLPDGRVQHVKYWSDATGYHASVTYHPLYQKFKHVK